MRQSDLDRSRCCDETRLGEFESLIAALQRNGLPMPIESFEGKIRGVGASPCLPTSPRERVGDGGSGKSINREP
jgi:hypothetical protein